MANSEQLDILNQGVDVWNRWREENDDILVKTKKNKLDIDAAEASWEVLRGLKPWKDFLKGIVPLDLSGADLSNRDLSNANFRMTNLNGGNLSNTTLNSTNLQMSFLCGTNFQNADLAEANLSKSYLIAADFSQADLGYVNFSQAVFSWTNISNAVLFCTIFGDVDLRDIYGLETVEHVGPSVVGMDTLTKSQGYIPEDFLRGVGCPESFIDYARFLVTRPIKYYSCFISHSSKDQTFAKRLCTDLRNNGVHCWFASRDMKTGDKIRQRIDESIRAYDKVLLILSQDSVKSTWVESEVEKAFDKERRKKKNDVLFPIRLDDAVMRTKQAWASEIRGTRHIGDFTNWKDYHSYQEAFKRLLRDLETAGKEAI